MSDPAHLLAIIEKAHEKIHAADLDYCHLLFNDAASRAYYAVFHTMTAILYSKGMVFSSHGQTIGAFNREFIKTGIFPESFSSIIHELFEDRQTGDYDVYLSITPEKAKENIDSAKRVLETIEGYLHDQGLI